MQIQKVKSEAIEWWAKRTIMMPGCVMAYFLHFGKLRKQIRESCPRFDEIARWREAEKVVQVY
jgi:hypothetical protein